MTDSTGSNRGGKRPGAGRKRTDPVYEAQLFGDTDGALSAPAHEADIDTLRVMIILLPACRKVPLQLQTS